MSFDHSAIQVSNYFQHAVFNAQHSPRSIQRVAFNTKYSTRSINRAAFNAKLLYPSVHLSLSSGLNFQGAKLFSILLNMPFHSAGALLSSIMSERRNSKIISNGLMLTGHSCTQALQEVQALNSSAVI